MTQPVPNDQTVPQGAIPVRLVDAGGDAFYTAGTPTPAGTGTPSTVNSSATAVTILAANASRKGASVVNDSTQILYLILSATTPTSTVFTVAMAGSSGGNLAYYETPFGYTGIIQGIWASANGTAAVVEYT